MAVDVVLLVAEIPVEATGEGMGAAAPMAAVPVGSSAVVDGADKHFTQGATI